MKNWFLLLLFPNVLGFNYNFAGRNIIGDTSHLDQKNIEKLEKMFISKNNYFPYRRKIFIIKGNDTNSNNVLNITSLLENMNNEFMKGFEENSTNVDGYENREDDDIGNSDYGSEGKKSIPQNGYMDPFGVFRYYRISGNKNPYQSSSLPLNSNDEFSGDGNFQIIKNSKHKFSDIGGYDKIKSELMQSADLLINYDKYKKYNVRVPKGIIFEGPPGNGKTLMAKCFSGELNVSFIPVSGSEFSEKYVGVGASRIRELFKLADEHKPSIIFIDEIDALARKRGMDSVSSNSEKDQTLNQLLISLDGFKSSDGVFVIGATNRIDLLDPALIRPGRIDKNIYIGNPDTKTRKEIIKIHSEGKPMSNTITEDYIVELTGGFSGAQIENLLNEAMLSALRENREIITVDDLEFIANRIVAGWQANESKFSDDIINRIVIHELGHAIIGFFSPEHPALVKVTLNLWSPKTPGYTLFENSDQDINIFTKNGLLSHLMVLLGGRVAEEIFYGYSVTTGAKKDLEEAYSLAKNMIMHYGMGEKSIYPDFSDQSKYLIDQEINKLILEAHRATLLILNNSKNLIIDCAEVLKKNNVLKPDDIMNILDTKYGDLKNMYIKNKTK
jgi:cell division protease FtsH